MSFTEAQNQAIESTGNVLLVAGAGAGKTKTLVEKCIRYLTDEKNKGSLDRVLMVTFTEAAAKEVRERIQAMLESRLNLDQGSQHLQEQLAKLDQAHISTLHGFCNYLVRKYILDLNLSPSFRICTDKTQQSIIEKTFESLFEELEGDPESEPFFTQYCEGGEKTFKSLILKLFFYSQSQPFPEAWLKGLQENIQSLETWKNLLKDQWLKQREVWRDLARRYDSPKSTDIYNALNKVQDSSDLSSWSAAVCHLDQLTKEAPTDIRVGKSYTRACQDLAFIYQLTGSEGDDFKQLSQDYALHSQSIRAVTKICLTFHKLYQKAKREQGFLDFSDLEQYALQLLWDHDRKKPSELACELRNDFDLIFVDEFQDINKVQDTIIRAISIPETGKGLFLVGDVKQSIYRFRLADPTIFLDYQDHWKTLDSQHGKVISLQENFRSHETILHFVNDIFQHFMKSPVGGIEYDQDAELRFSDGGNRSHFKKRIFPEEVQIQTWAKDKSGPVTDPETGEETENPGELIVESRNVAQTIRGLVQSGYPIFESDGSSRPVKFEDIAILVSSKKAVIEPLAREFAAAGVPLYAV
ncbi:MAG: addA, partial [Verrucomicrobiales bacterium]|nr:addA [Verrucomicrobiales bacterium]